MKKIISSIFIIVMMLFLYPVLDVNAADLRISASSTSITNGSTVRVTVNASGIAGRFSITSSNSGVLSGGTNSEWLENESKTYTFTSKGIGSATITVTPINAAYTDGSGKVASSKSITIKVVKPREKSTNNNLKSLSVEGYNLTPEFNKDTLEYTVEVNDDKETIKINAEKEDGYASLDGDGEKEVAEGTNKFEVKVTSETGKEKVYTLNINVTDSNPIEKKVGNETYYLVKRSKSLVLPDGINSELFKTDIITMDDKEIPVLVSEELNLTLIGLKDETGTVYLYKLVKDEITDRYEILKSNSLTIEFKQPNTIIEGYKKISLKIGDKKYTAYQNKYTNYALIYGTNIDTKEDNWYLYNINEKSIQTYAKDMIDDLNNEHNKEIEQYKIIIAGLAGLSILLLLIVIILAAKKRKSPKIKEEKIIDNKEDVNETVKQIDKAEIIINKVNGPNLEEEVKASIKKAVKVKEEKSDEFLNTKDLEEILDNPKEEKKEPTAKKVKKSKKVKETKKEELTEEEMATDFLDEYKGKKKRK